MKLKTVRGTTWAQQGTNANTYREYESPVLPSKKEATCRGNEFTCRENESTSYYMQTASLHG